MQEPSLGFEVETLENHCECHRSSRSFHTEKVTKVHPDWLRFFFYDNHLFSKRLLHFAFPSEHKQDMYR